MKKITLILSAIAIMFMVACGGEDDREKKKCKDFETWEEADEVFQSDPEFYKKLDKDGDGCPCESLKKKDKK